MTTVTESFFGLEVQLDDDSADMDGIAVEYSFIDEATKVQIATLIRNEGLFGGYFEQEQQQPDDDESVEGAELRDNETRLISLLYAFQKPIFCQKFLQDAGFRAQFATLNFQAEFDARMRELEEPPHADEMNAARRLLEYEMRHDLDQKINILAAFHSNATQDSGILEVDVFKRTLSDPNASLETFKSVFYFLYSDDFNILSLNDNCADLFMSSKRLRTFLLSDGCDQAKAQKLKGLLQLREVKNLFERSGAFQTWLLSDNSTDNAIQAFEDFLRVEVFPQRRLGNTQAVQFLLENKRFTTALFQCDEAKLTTILEFINDANDLQGARKAFFATKAGRKWLFSADTTVEKLEAVGALDKAFIPPVNAAQTFIPDKKIMGWLLQKKPSVEEIDALTALVENPVITEWMPKDGRKKLSMDWVLKGSAGLNRAEIVQAIYRSAEIRPWFEKGTSKLAKGSVEDGLRSRLLASNMTSVIAKELMTIYRSSLTKQILQEPKHPYYKTLVSVLTNQNQSAEMVSLVARCVNSSVAVEILSNTQHTEHRALHDAMSGADCDVAALNAMLTEQETGLDETAVDQLIEGKGISLFKERALKKFLANAHGARLVENDRFKTWILSGDVTETRIDQMREALEEGIIHTPFDALLRRAMIEGGASEGYLNLVLKNAFGVLLGEEKLVSQHQRFWTTFAQAMRSECSAGPSDTKLKILFEDRVGDANLGAWKSYDRTLVERLIQGGQMTVTQLMQMPDHYFEALTNRDVIERIDSGFLKIEWFLGAPPTQRTEVELLELLGGGSWLPQLIEENIEPKADGKNSVGVSHQFSKAIHKISSGNNPQLIHFLRNYDGNTESLCGYLITSGFVKKTKFDEKRVTGVELLEVLSKLDDHKLALLGTLTQAQHRVETVFGAYQHAHPAAAEALKQQILEVVPENEDGQEKRSSLLGLLNAYPAGDLDELCAELNTVLGRGTLSVKGVLTTPSPEKKVSMLCEQLSRLQPEQLQDIEATLKTREAGHTTAGRALTIAELARQQEALEAFLKG